MAETLTETDFVKAKYFGQEIAAAGSAGYWLKCCGRSDAASYHRLDIVNSAKALCALLGLRVVDGEDEL